MMCNSLWTEQLVAMAWMEILYRYCSEVFFVGSVDTSQRGRTAYVEAMASGVM
jgi:hypothetical protein